MKKIMKDTRKMVTSGPLFLAHLSYAGGSLDANLKTQATWRERTLIQARHTVKLMMNRGCLRKQARGDGWPKWHKELMAAAVRAASIRRQVRPPADLATGVFRLSRRIIAELEVIRRQLAKNKSRVIERGLSQASSRTVLFRHRSLLLGAHSSGRHSWHVVGSEEETQHREKKRQSEREREMGCKRWSVVFSSSLREVKFN